MLKKNMNIRIIIITIALVVLFSAIIAVCMPKILVNTIISKIKVNDTKWWNYYTPSLSHLQGYWKNIEEINPGMVRHTAQGTHGIWQIDNQKYTGGYYDNNEEAANSFGAKRVYYLDTDELAGTLVFTDNSNNILYSKYDIGNYKGNGMGLTARWIDVRDFMYNRSLILNGKQLATAGDLNVKMFTYPDGRKPEYDKMYEAISSIDIYGNMNLGSLSPAEIISEKVAKNSGLGEITRRDGEKWFLDYRYSADRGCKPLIDYKSAEIWHSIEMNKPDVLHFDDFGASLFNNVKNFGEWTVYNLKSILKAEFSKKQLAGFGIDDIETFDPRDYFLHMPWASEYFTGLGVKDISKRKQAESLKYFDSEFWLSDTIFRIYQISRIKDAQSYYKRIYSETKKASSKIIGSKIPVTGNLIPTFTGAGFLKDMVDIPDYEWKLFSTYGFFYRADGYYPDARMGYHTRLAAKMSKTGYTILHAYVDDKHAGSKFDELHKVMHFDALANRAMLSFGYWFQDGYTPGTIQSAGFCNTFTKKVSNEISKREYIADYALLQSDWSGIAATGMQGSQRFNNNGSAPERYLSEYVGWGRYLAGTNLQWNIVMADNMTIHELKNYKVIILPSLLVLTPKQVKILDKYTKTGGRIVITGDSGKFQGPEGFLLPYKDDVLVDLKNNKNVKYTEAKPGMAYEKDPNSENSETLKRLLEFNEIFPVLTTDAKATTGVSLSRSVQNTNRLTIDCVNYNIDVEKNRITKADGFTIDIKNEKFIKGKKDVSIRYIQADNEFDDFQVLDKTEYEINTDESSLRIKVPEFKYYQLLVIDIK